MTDETSALIEAEKNASTETQIAEVFQDKKTEPVKTDELIEASINTAIISRITTDDKIQEKFKRTADTVIDNKLETEQSNAEKVAKKGHLQNNQDACDNITITFFDYDPHIKAIERPIQNTGQLILRDIHQRGNSIRLILYYDYPKGPYVPQYGGGALPNSNGSIITGTNFQQDMGSLQIANSAIFSCPVQLLNSDQTPI